MDLHTALCVALDYDLCTAVPGYPGRDGALEPYLNHPGISRQQFAAAALGRSFWKKFQDQIDQEAADKAAFKLFSFYNQRCSEWSPEKGSGELGPFDDEIVGEVKSILWEFFNPGGDYLLSHAAIEANVDFGPGAGPGADDVTFYHKIGASRLSSPNELVTEMFYEWVYSKGSRVECEISRIMAHGLPEVVVNRIVAVPKTTKISRLVKSEPLLGMFFQKGVQKLLERRLREYFGIDLTEQPDVNRRLARLGSISQKFSTIDLSSASDCISLNACRDLLPRQVYNWLVLFRSERAITPDGIVDLNMMATMGNAYCFPLQTIIFAAIVKAVYRCRGISFDKGDISYRIEGGQIAKRLRLPSFGVFGDDIVVHWAAYDAVNRILRYYGFVPNLDKSYTAPSPFRESCGADYYCGHNVRGVYCNSLKTKQDRYALINNLVDWSAKTGIRLNETIGLLLQSVPRIEVPPWENADSGLRVPLSCIQTAKVFRALRPSRNGTHYQGSYLYAAYRSSPKSYDVDELLKEGNASAVYLQASRGMTRAGRIYTRNDGKARYVLKTGVAPCWDHRPDGTLGDQDRCDWFVVAEGYYRS